MTFQSTAQELYVIDPVSPASQLPADVQSASELHTHLPGPEQAHNLHLIPIEVTEPVDVEIVVEELPGAPAGTRDPEPMIEVMEDPLHAEEKEDTNDAKKGKGEKWDWASKGSNGFVTWIKERLENVPKHSGFDSAGLQRAMAYLEKLDNEISKAMRMDLDGELDANKVEKVRAELDDGLSRLQVRIDKVNKAKKSNRKKKAEYIVDEDGFIKEAQKITGVKGTYVMVPLLISGLARIIVNGMISAGHDCEDASAKLTKKFNLNEREQFELRMCLYDMGMPMRIDRGLSPDELIDQTSSDNFDWMANFQS